MGKRIGLRRALVVSFVLVTSSLLASCATAPDPAVPAGGGTGTLEFARLIIAEAALSFLGPSGVAATVPSWGQMLSEGREVLFFGGWWVATFPGVAITLVVLAVNLFGDVLAEALDPRASDARSPS